MLCVSLEWASFGCVIKKYYYVVLYLRADESLQYIVYHWQPNRGETIPDLWKQVLQKDAFDISFTLFLHVLRMTYLNCTCCRKAQ